MRVFNFLRTRICARNLFADDADISKRVAVLNLSYGNFNFGAVLLSYATQKLLLRLELTPYILNYNPEFKNYWRISRIRGMIAGMNFIRFRYSFLNTTRVYWNLESLRGANKDFGTFLFGSDQIWRYAIINGNYGIYFGKFAADSKRLAAYAASFGKDKWDEAPESATKDISRLLKRFSAVSVREESGVKICADSFGVKAEAVLDPTLLLSAEDYAPIIDTAGVKTGFKYVAKAYLDNSPLCAAISDAVAKTFPEKEINILCRMVGLFGKLRPIYRPVADWLALIRDAEFVITDSFHCSVFAILFRKQFVCIATKERGNSRLENLFDKLGIQSRLVYSPSSVSELLKTPIDFDDVFARLDRERVRCIDFLKNSLSTKTG